MSYCKKCHRLVVFEDTHRCPPAWEIWDEDGWGDEYQTVYGSDAEDAGEVYARIHDDDGDYPLTNGEDYEVKIRKKATDGQEPEPWQTFILTAEQDVNYHAREKED